MILYQHWCDYIQHSISTGVTIYNKYKNEVECRDDTVPKTVGTRRHCEEAEE